MNSPISLAQVAQILSLPLSDTRMISHVDFDSRHVTKGSLFFALEGARVDGHTFLEDVAAKKALAAVVSDTYQGPDFGLTLLKVKSPLKALQKLAHHLLSHSKALCLGITGSVGKTTTKELTYQLLKASKKVVASQGSYNSQVGLPYSLINQWNEPEIVVAEMGINQKGEMAQLAAMVQPHIGLMTRLVHAHTEQLESLEGIAWEKCHLFKNLRIQKGVFHKSSLTFEAVKALEIVKKSYALEDEACDYTLKEIEGGVALYEAGKQVAVAKLPFSQRPLLENVLAAYALCREAGVEISALVGAMTDLKLAPHRFCELEHKGIHFIDDSYNASPYAMRQALYNLIEKKGQRRIAVLGGMAELGALTTVSHQEVASMALEYLDEVFFLGANWSEIEGVSKERLFFNKEALQKALFPFIQGGDAVLIKGANGLKMWELIEAY